jgi:hypothetical protein
MLVWDQIVTLAVLANAACQLGRNRWRGGTVQPAAGKEKGVLGSSDIALEDDPGLRF